MILFNITLLCCLSFRMDIYETNGKAPLFFKRGALGKGRKVYVCDKHMCFAKRRHNAPKRTSGCRASGRHKSIPIPRISFVDTQERIRIRRFTLTMYAQKNSKTNGGETFRRRMNFSENRNLTAMRAFTSRFSSSDFNARRRSPKQICRFFEKCEEASEKRQKRFLFATLSPSLRLRWGKPTSFTPFAAVWGYLRRSLAKIQRKTRKNHA